MTRVMDKKFPSRSESEKYSVADGRVGMWCSWYGYLACTIRNAIYNGLVFLSIYTAAPSREDYGQVYWPDQLANLHSDTLCDLAPLREERSNGAPMETCLAVTCVGGFPRIMAVTLLLVL